MEINSSGIKKSDLTDYLGFWTDKLREVFGNQFVIKKEGLVDNIATAGSLTCLALEDVIMYLAKQINPYTAEGEFQDKLYSYVGLERTYADFTVVTRTIEGVANTVCDVKSIRFKNNATDDIFELNTPITIGSNGKAVGSFTAIELGAIDLTSSDTLSIIDAPDGISAVYYTEGNTTNIGDDYEDDSEFRMEWLAKRSVLPTSKTEGGLRTALLDLVDNTNNLRIRQNRTNSTVDSLPAHSLEVVLKSAYSDNDIAQKILDHVTDGVGIYGTTTVTLQDSEGTDTPIKFTRATSVGIDFKLSVKMFDGYTLDKAKVIKAITDNFNYVLGEKVVANDFYQYINAIEGVDYVSNIQIQVKDALDWEYRVELDYDEYATPNIDETNITEAL